MNKKILVGVTQRVNKVEFYDEWRDQLDQRLVNWVIESGFIPIPIPNTLVDTSAHDNDQKALQNWLDVLKIDVILLSGGNDIGVIKHRDLTENFLLAWADKNRKPVLGICRGMQMMGFYAGAKLIEIDGHVGKRHQLKIKNSHGLSLPKSVNSYHNLAIKKCPDMYEILAESEDGIIEAISHKKLPWEGWMWHPEREEQFVTNDKNRFITLVNYEKTTT